MSTSIYYLPSPVEAERQAAQPKCGLTRHVIAVGGSVVHDDDRGACPFCGGAHVVRDEFDDAAAAEKALSLIQPNQQAYVRGKDGTTGFFTALSDRPADRTKIVSDYRNRMRS